MSPKLPTVPVVAKELGDLAQLLYDWPARKAPRLALPFFILLAAVVQAAGMILFSISYRTPGGEAPWSPQIYFLPPDSAAARQLAPWLAANDPAVFSPLHTAREALPAPPPLKYRPSYEEPPPPLKPLPEESPVTVEPPPIPVVGIAPRRVVPATSVARAEGSPSSLLFPATVVRWQDELADRIQQSASAAETPPLARSSGSCPSLYQVAIGPEGVPRHCVLTESSGNPEDDEAGRVWIMGRRFEPANRITWGRALVLWGAAATPPPSKP